MKLHEIHDPSQPLIWNLVGGLIEKGHLVRFEASHVRGGDKMGGWVTKIWNGGYLVKLDTARSTEPPTFFAAFDEDDDWKTIKKIKHHYTIVDTDSLHESDARPMIWQLVDQRIDKGEKVLFHAHLPNSSSYFVGRIRGVGATRAIADPPAFNRSDVIIPFHEDDDSNLTITRSNDQTIADWVVRDAT